MNNSKTLNFRDRAALFKQLAVMQKAGLGYQQILARLADPKEKILNSKAQACAKRLKNGEPLDSAALKSGLFSQTEAAIVKTALHTGTSDRIFSTLARQHENNDIRLRKVKSRLFMPGCILIMAKFISPLPTLVSGKLGIGQYVLEGTLFAILVVISLKFLLGLPARLGQTNNIKSNLDKIILKTPVIGSWFRKKETCKWLELTGICLEAGLPMHEVIPTISNSLLSSSIRQSFEQTQQQLINGATVHDALKNNPNLSNETKNFIHTGESSGRLAELITHSAMLEKQRLQLLEDQLTEWAPRIVYFLVVITLASNILGSSFTTPYIE